jgi:tRNA 2-thiouridine synthesizing protein A
MTDRKVIDARGTYCPGPLMELIAALKLATVGDEIEVLSSDEGSATDIPVWIGKVGHQLISSSNDGGAWHVVVRKAK